jgi:uncharacterized protein (TIGR03067 family)
MMRRAQLCALITVLAWISTVTADNKQDQAMMQGTWQDDVDKEASVVIEGDTMKLLSGKAVLSTLKFELDASKSPGRIDFTIAEGMGKGEKMLGIYKFEGDKLVITYPLPSFDGGKLTFGQPRPSSFPTGKSPRVAFLKLRKVPKE